MPRNSCAIMTELHIPIGTLVTIRRSDGRTHAATVTRVQQARRITAVEWDEGTERKGKAIPIQDLLRMNPFLFDDERSDIPESGGNVQADRSKPRKELSSLSSDSDLNNQISIYKENIDSHQSNLQSRLERNNNSNIKNYDPTNIDNSMTNSQFQWPNSAFDQTAPQFLKNGKTTARSSINKLSKTSVHSNDKSVTMLRSKMADARSVANMRKISEETSSAWPRRSLKTRSNNARPTTTGAHAHSATQALKQQCEPPSSAHVKQKDRALERRRVVTNSAKSSFDSSGNSSLLPKVSESVCSIALPKKQTPSCDNVVKVIRDMEQNRKELRRQHADMRADKEYRKSISKHWEIIQMIEEYRSTLDFQPFRSRGHQNDHKITVCIRKRPLSAEELAKEEVDILTVPNEDHIVAHELKQKVDNTKYIVNQCFRFDYVFDVDCSNEFVYEYTAKPLVQTMFKGGKATCFAYGQTGSGKTHTMGGAAKNSVIGIYALAAIDVFTYLEMPQFRDLKLTVVASYYEIYGSKIFDLLERRAPLSIMEGKGGKVNVCGLSEKIVQSPEDVLRLIQRGNKARSSGKTSANENSSRSHAIFQLVLQHRGVGKMYGKFSLIDLAGNERGSDNTSHEKKSKMETAQINTSLLVLKECIRAMAREGAHLPFRGSKLTHVLRDSFIGEKTKTCMIATISPGFSCCDHTVDTLRYADRVKGLAVKDPRLLGKSITGEA